MISKYQMWLTFNGEREKIRFPVLPDSYDVSKGNNNRSVNVQGLGEIVVMQDPAAMVISFNCFFPADVFPGVQFQNLTPPIQISEKIDTWKNSGKPVHFIITSAKVNMFCSIEDFKYGEQGGDVGALHYSITLKEYRDVKARQVKINTKSKKASVPKKTRTRTDNRVTEKTHTVVSGDTLWGISARHLGSGARYNEIFNLNRNIINNPNLIFPGQVLRLP